jgi:hypothetical protein
MKIGLTDQDITGILTDIVPPKNGMVDYVTFCQLSRKRSSIGGVGAMGFDQTSQSGFGSASQIDMDRGLSMTREV